MIRHCFSPVLFVLATLTATIAVRADHDPVPGHSQHGDAFNEGPRQEAHLMPGMGAVHFAITTKSALAQKFFDQGIGQLHGFFYFEAERSFRQAAALDASCAMAYWGMAMANSNNAKRAKEFIQSAEKLKNTASPREQRWITALADFHREEKKDEKKDDKKDEKKSEKTAVAKDAKPEKSPDPKNGKNEPREGKPSAQQGEKPAGKPAENPAATPAAKPTASTESTTPTTSTPAQPPPKPAEKTETKKPEAAQKSGGRNDKSDKQDRVRAYNQALEKITKDFPDDIEAKALFAVQLWQSTGKGIADDYKPVVNKLLDAVLAANRFHPANHYRIHIWDDGARATNALVSASNCGPSAPGIAHMWHMSGHTYSALKRYSDAAWQQEASARVDHAYMMGNRVLPDQIHNFAHNNEWLTRDLNNIGAARRAIDLAKNMIELPRHPKFNTLTKGSSAYGYQRLLETLTRYELWEELVTLADSVYLQPTDNNDHEARRFHALGLAALNTGNLAAGKKHLAALEALAAKLTPKPAPTNTPTNTPTAKTNAVAAATGANANATAAKTNAVATSSGTTNNISKTTVATATNTVATSVTNRVANNIAASAPKEIAKPENKPATNAIAAARPIPAASTNATNPPPKIAATTNAPAQKTATKDPAAKDTAAKDAAKPDPKKAAPNYGGASALLAVGNTNAIANAVAELRCLLAVKEGKLAAAKEQLAKLKEVPKDRFAQMHYAVGETNRAEQIAEDAVKSFEKLVQPLASHADFAWRNGHQTEAFAAFIKLRDLSAEADLALPVFRRLAPVAKALGLAADWRPPLTRAMDFGARPSLDSLGPFRWQPSAAPDWTLPSGEDRTFSLRQFRGKPVIVIFYLGSGCAHCIEQLVAFAPMADEFKAAGIALVAVSTDSVEGLRDTAEKAKYNGGFPIPLVSDASLKTFKTYRAHDDFEAKPLHGIFLIDGDGLIRWQDISYQPFMDGKFLLTEAKRQLGLPKNPSTAARADAPKSAQVN